MVRNTKLPPVTASITEAAKRMAAKTHLPVEKLERDLVKGTQAVNIAYARKAKENALDRGDFGEYRAWMIKEARFTAGVTQKQLAGLIGTRQPSIARLEDPEYKGQSLNTIMKIAKALGMYFQPPRIVRGPVSV